MKSNLLKLYFIFLSFLVVSELFSQINNEYKNTFSIDPLSIADRTISISYARRLNDKYEFTLNPKYHFQSKKDNTIIFGIMIDDPYWIYNSLSVRSGIRRSINGKMYVEPIIYYKYASFDSLKLKIEDHEGDQFDRYQTLKREYNSVGLIIKSGFIFEKSHFRLNIFYGLGINLRKYKQDILNEYYWHAQNPSFQPESTTYWKNYPTINLGIEIGFKI